MSACQTPAHMLGITVRFQGAAQYVVVEGHVPQHHRRLDMLYCQATITWPVLRERCVDRLCFADVVRSSSYFLCNIVRDSAYVYVGISSQHSVTFSAHGHIFTVR